MRRYYLIKFSIISQHLNLLNLFSRFYIFIPLTLPCILSADIILIESVNNNSKINNSFKFSSLNFTKNGLLRVSTYKPFDKENISQESVNSNQELKQSSYTLNNKGTQPERRRRKSVTSSWREQHPQSRHKWAYTSIGEGVSAPSRRSFSLAYRLQCHSCMSAYLEDQFMFISHLYRRPLAFTEKCDRGNFDWRYVRTKNCTDPCVTLRMNDKVGGRRRHGYMRGCLSDIIHYNHSVISVYGKNTAGSSKAYEKNVRMNTGSSGVKTLQYLYCNYVRLRDLFLTSDRYNFDAFDHVELCTCIRPLCNKSAYTKCPNRTLWGFYAISIMLSLLFPQFLRNIGK